jgi:hypothetical protein
MSKLFMQNPAHFHAAALLGNPARDTLHLMQSGECSSNGSCYVSVHRPMQGHHPMRFFVCFGFLLAATAAQAQTYTTVVNGNTKTVTTTGPNATATTVQTSSSGSTRTYTTTITKNGGGYQPMGGSGYNPMGK